MSNGGKPAPPASHLRPDDRTSTPKPNAVRHTQADPGQLRSQDLAIQAGLRGFAANQSAWDAAFAGAYLKMMASQFSSWATDAQVRAGGREHGLPSRTAPGVQRSAQYCLQRGQEGQGICARATQSVL